VGDVLEVVTPRGRPDEEEPERPRGGESISNGGDEGAERLFTSSSSVTSLLVTSCCPEEMDLWTRLLEK